MDTLRMSHRLPTIPIPTLLKLGLPHINSHSSRHRHHLPPFLQPKSVLLSPTTVIIVILTTVTSILPQNLNLLLIRMAPRPVSLAKEAHPGRPFRVLPRCRSRRAFPQAVQTRWVERMRQKRTLGREVDRRRRESWTEVRSRRRKERGGGMRGWSLKMLRELSWRQ